MPVSLKDVAAHAKVSPATVSGVLNRRSYCWASEKTAERVMRSVRELGYVPNRAARGLRTSKFMTVGLILPDLTNPFNAMLARVTTERLNRIGYSLVIEDNMASLEHERRSYERILERQVDGVFLTVIDPMAFLKKMGPRKPLPKPTVVIGGPVPPKMNLDLVESDYAPGLSEAVQHLVAHGHTRIAFFGGRIGGVTVDSVRLRIIEKVFTEHGLTLDPRLQLNSDVTLSNAFDVFDRFLKDTPKSAWPTAILALNDLVALAIEGAAQRHGLRVPENLSIVGMDDIELARYLPTPLSTISHSLEEVMDRAVELMIARIDASEPLPPSKVTFPTKFIARDSTGPAPRPPTG